MWQSVFEFLFKYRPVVFENGRLEFGVSWSPWAVVVLAAIIVGAISWSYLMARGRSGRRDRWILMSLRLGALGLLGIMLSRPMLVVATVVPQQNYLGILLDDSESMRIEDHEGGPRSAFFSEQFAAEKGVLLESLADKFVLRFFRFGRTASPIEGLGQMTLNDDRTDLGHALEVARRDLSAVPLAGLVVVTDGADNTGKSLTESILTLSERSVPVYAVGLGREEFERDVQVGRVQAPSSLLKGSSLVLDVLITQAGYTGRTVRLDVEDEGQLISTEEVELPREGQAATVRVQFTAETEGPRRFRFGVRPLEGEKVTENNWQEVLIQVRDGRPKVLYFEGEPRFEVKFMRRALAEDENVQLVVLQRTAENKFLRLDVDDPDELAGGFPKSREELFEYSGLILGSVEASFFTHDQLRMISEFVDQRGGGLLVLGGRRALAEGGYAGTAVADVLPIVIQDPADTGRYFQELTVDLTPVGEHHPITRVGRVLAEKVTGWSQLPPLSIANRLGATKPGASTLLRGQGDGLDDPVPVLTLQRFGRGKSITFPVQDSWIWQMHADIPLDDLTHETLWRQLVRWLVSYVPEQVSVELSSDRASPGDTVAIRATVDDPTYLRVNNAQASARVIAPSGAEREIRLDWVVDRDGEYLGSLSLDEPGLYRVEVSAGEGNEMLGTAEAFVEATSMPREFFQATRRTSLLERLAEETGGEFYTSKTVSTLPEDVSFTESGATTIERRDLWDMPIIFLLLVTVLGGEWLLRRRKQLA